MFKEYRSESALKYLRPPSKWYKQHEFRSSLMYQTLVGYPLQGMPQEQTETHWHEKIHGFEFDQNHNLLHVNEVTH